MTKLSQMGKILIHERKVLKILFLEKVKTAEFPPKSGSPVRLNLMSSDHSIKAHKKNMQKRTIVSNKEIKLQFYVVLAQYEHHRTADVHLQFNCTRTIM